MKKTVFEILAISALIGTWSTARAQALHRTVCQGGAVRVDVAVCPAASRQGSVRPTTVPPPLVAPAPAPMVPPALVVQRPSVVQKPKKQFTLRFGLGLDVFPFDVSVRLSKHVAWSTHFLLFGLGDKHDGVFFGGLLTGLDWYFGQRVFDGLHLGVRAGLFGVHESGDANDAVVPMARAGIGYDWLFEGFVTLGIEGGIHYVHIGGDELSIHMVFPYLRLSGGLVF